MGTFKVKIPEISDDVVKVYSNNEFIGNATCEQVNRIRISIVEHILKTGDTSVLNGFYLIGHSDSNSGMGKEIKVTMDEKGNLSDMPWELSHNRRDMLRLINLINPRGLK